MKKIITKLLLMALIILMAIILTGCSKNNSIVDENIEDLETSSQLEIEKGLFDVELKIPAAYIEGKTQEELDALAKENGYKSVTLNEDGSATYIMTKSQHKKMLKELKNTLDTGLNELIGSEEYPSFTKIEANDNYTDFTITTTRNELDMTERFSVFAFYMYGGMYNVFSGEEADNVHVKFVNDATGETILETNSSEMANK